MAKNRIEKEQIVSNYKNLLDTYQTYIFIDITKVKTTEIEKFKDILSNLDTKYFLLKNTLFEKTLKESKKDLSMEELSSPTGGIFSNGEVNLVMKKLLDFINDNPTISIKFAFVEGNKFNADELKEISKIPSRKILETMLVVGIKSPITQFVNDLSNIERNFLYTLKAIESKK